MPRLPGEARWRRREAARFVDLAELLTRSIMVLSRTRTRVDVAAHSGHQDTASEANNDIPHRFIKSNTKR